MLGILSLQLRHDGLHPILEDGRTFGIELDQEFAPARPFDTRQDFRSQQQWTVVIAAIRLLQAIDQKILQLLLLPGREPRQEALDDLLVEGATTGRVPPKWSRIPPKL